MRSLLLFLFLATATYAQKQLVAKKIDAKITIDGQLNEAVWDQNNPVEKWTQIKPNPGQASLLATSVQL
ncbi:MAG: hypothetical protein ACO29Z_01730, partial [Crocinitomicaceae bacterium]